MYVQGTTDQPRVPLTNAGFSSRLPLPLALVFCVYLFFVGTTFIKIVPLFARLFDGLQVEIPWLTRLLLLNYWWALPLFSFLAIGLAVVRQVVSLNKALRWATNAFLFFVAFVLPSVVVLALYMPTLELMWKAHSLR